MNFKLAKLCAIGAIVLCNASSSSAAVTFTQGQVLSAADILKTGTVLEANSVGGLRQAVSISGISFGTSEAALGGMVDSGGDFSGQFANGSAMDKLFSSLAFQNGSSSSLNLTGLTSGATYFLQLFLQNNINSTGKSSAVTLQNQTYDIANFGNDSDYLRINFTATSSSQFISFGKNSSSEPDRMVLNAYALETAAPPVPTPGTLPLLGIAGVALAWLRRKVA